MSRVLWIMSLKRLYLFHCYRLQMFWNGFFSSKRFRISKHGLRPKTVPYTIIFTNLPPNFGMKKSQLNPKNHTSGMIWLDCQVFKRNYKDWNRSMNNLPPPTKSGMPFYWSNFLIIQNQSPIYITDKSMICIEVKLHNLHNSTNQSTSTKTYPQTSRSIPPKLWCLNGMFCWVQIITFSGGVTGCLGYSKGCPHFCNTRKPPPGDPPELPHLLPLCRGVISSSMFHGTFTGHRSGG